MRKALRYRLFGMGKMPEALAAAAADAHVLPGRRRAGRSQPGLVAVLAAGSGTVEVHYRIPLEESLLSQLPAKAFPVTLSHAVEALLNPWRGSYVGGSRTAGG